MFGGVIFKLADIMVFNNINPNNNNIPSISKGTDIPLKHDIVDRNGMLLAASISTASCYIDPSSILDAKETAEKLSRIKEMPSTSKIFDRIKDNSKKFVWILRHISPKVQQEIINLGLPGVMLKKDYKRFYPHGNLFSHVIGFCDIDGIGIGGIEKQFDEELKVRDLGSSSKLVLSFDLRLQSIIREELCDFVDKFKADGGNAMLMKTNGEILAMVSLPDFDPNSLRIKNPAELFNRNTLGVFEPGSTFKIVNVAIALESGSASIGSTFDATSPIRLGRFSIKDFRGKNRILTLAEAFVFSSNIAAVKIAQEFGPKIQKSFMDKLELFHKINLEIPEIGKAIVPNQWREATSMTASYGYGISVTPLNLLKAITTIVSNGKIPNVTLIKGHGGCVNSDQNPVVSARTSGTVRDLMRATVSFGTAKKAAVDGVQIIGKTGTAYKISKRGYGSDGNRARITTFIGGFPKNKPEYMLVVMLDDPKPIEGTYGYATAGWNAAPLAGAILNKIVPILMPHSESEEELKITKYINLK